MTWSQSIRRALKGFRGIRSGRSTVFLHRKMYERKFIPETILLSVRAFPVPCPASPQKSPGAPATSGSNG